MKYFHLKNISLTHNIENYNISPGKIIKGSGVIQEANNAITDPSKSILIADRYIMKQYGNLISSRQVKSVIFKGEVCPSEIYRIKKIISENGIKEVISMGGGKAMDIAKLAKRDIGGIKLTLIPTSCATCAAYTAVSVIYNEDHSYMDTVDVPTADNLFIDYEIFGRLPSGFYAAGIADTLAKYYETAAYRKYTKVQTLDDNMVFETAKSIYKRLKEIIIKKWAKLDGPLKRELTDINIIYSGIVSTMGKYSVTSSIAHAISYAMTIIPETREFLHGEHVAMGLMIEETAVKNEKNLWEIETFFEIIDLPKRWQSFRIKKNQLKDIFGFYIKIRDKEKIHIPIKDDLMYNIFSKLI